MLRKNNFSTEGDAIVKAAEMDRDDIIEKWLSSGVQIDYINPAGITALIAAASKGHLKTVNFLIEKSANIHFKTLKTQDTSLILSAYHGHAPIVKVLLEYKANLHDLDQVGFTPFTAAIDQGHGNVVSLLLEKKADVHEICQHEHYKGESSFIFAVSTGKLPVIKILVSGKADINQRNKDGQSLLEMAVDSSNFYNDMPQKNIVTFLLKQGAIIDDIHRFYNHLRNFYDRGCYSDGRRTLQEKLNIIKAVFALEKRVMSEYKEDISLKHQIKEDLISLQYVLVQQREYIHDKIFSFLQKETVIHTILQYLNFSEQRQEEIPIPYLINEKKPTERELLVHASPLIDNQQMQKKGNDFDFALHYIRCRYSFNVVEYKREKAVEEALNDARKKINDLKFLWPETISFIRTIFFHVGASLINKEKLIELLMQGYNLKHYQYTFSDKRIHLLTDQINKIINEICLKFKNDDQLKQIGLDEIQKRVDTFYLSQLICIMKKILTSELGFNFRFLYVDFFKERNCNIEPPLDNFSNISIDCLAVLTTAIYYERIASFFDLHFIEKDSLQNIDMLLNELEKKGPSVCKILGMPSIFFNIRRMKSNSKKYIKSHSGFPIIKIELSDPEPYSNEHYIVLVGGRKNSEAQFVYFIDPNFTYSRQNKIPVFQVLYEQLMKHLQPLDCALSIKGISFEKEEKTFSLSKRFFLFGKQGLNPTRDPAPKNNSLSGSINQHGEGGFKKVQDIHLMRIGCPARG